MTTRVLKTPDKLIRRLSDSVLIRAMLWAVVMAAVIGTFIALLGFVVHLG